MANKDHLKRLTSEYRGWNEWRVQNPNIVPDLRSADLEGQLLIGKDLSNAILDRANLNRADLRHVDMTRTSIRNANIYDAHFNQAILEETDFSGSVIIRSSFPRAKFRGTKLKAEIQKVNFQKASFRGTDLSGVRFLECDFYGADLTGADLTGCEVYGASVWDLATDKATKQYNLIVQRRGGPKVVVDDIEVAQFICLLLRREKIRNVIDTITSKAVLVLGRFTPERKVVLDALSEELRHYQLLPIVFDFEGSAARDLTETIKILASMSLFVIADVSNPKSSPLELQATVPDYRIPFVPIIQEGEKPFAMLDDLKKYDWVLQPVLTYSSIEKLREGFKPAILDRAWDKHHELQKARADRMKTRSVEDFIKRGGE